MICNYRSLLIFFLPVLFFFPVALLAQGNHCVAQKSPLKMGVAAGQPLYVSKCQVCHQADGAGLPDKNPSLIKSKLITGDKQQLIELMIKGVQAQPAPGVKKYSQEMPSYAGLSEEDLANLLTYIRRSFGNRASLVKPAEVKAVKERLKN